MGAYAAVIPKWIVLFIGSEPVYINGDGETSRDFCYDLTVSGALLLLALPIMLLAALCIYLESGLPVRVG